MCFHGGSYRILPGINEHATFILKRLPESLFFHRDNFPDREYVRMATSLIHATLALSERICAAAGITRNPQIESRFQEGIVVPGGTVLTRLKGAVRFSREGFGLRDEYNAMLVGKGSTAADEVLARVETILRNEKASWYKVVAKIRVHGPTPRDAKQKVLLFFPPLKALQ
jgi:hypothetical protein